MEKKVGKIRIELTMDELEVVYRGLLEIVSKFSLPVIRVIEEQVRKQTTEENAGPAE